MIQTIDISIRCWHPAGTPVNPSAFVGRLGLQFSASELRGNGEPWQAARGVLAALSSDAYSGAAEPSEAFAAAMEGAWSAVVRRLQGVGPTVVDELRKDGYLLDIVVNATIDQNQFDFQLRPDVTAELARLRLPLVVVTND
jgi:hypothetical protein